VNNPEFIEQEDKQNSCFAKFRIDRTIRESSLWR